MKNLLPFLSLMLCLSACDKKSEENTQASELVTEDKNTSQCFAYQANKDSALLHIEQTGDRIAGELTYKLFEKDSNAGEIDGSMRGDTLFAYYRFRSEGSESVREVVFLRKDKTWVEGFGTVTERGDSAVFADKKKLQFDGNMVFSPVECP